MAITIPTQVSNSKIVSWTLSSDEEVVQALQDAYNGTVDLEQDYGWCVGQERTVHLSAMAATGVDESYEEQDVTFVLMNKGGYTLTSGIQCQFVVGLKNCLTQTAKMSSGYGSYTWDTCIRRPWCNNVFRNAIPQSLVAIFKQFSCITGAGDSLITTQDYFALPAVTEFVKGFATGDYYYTADDSGANRAKANKQEWYTLNRWSYYSNCPANLVKAKGNLSTMLAPYWTRSSNSSGFFVFCSPSNANNFCSTSVGSTTGYCCPVFGCI